MSLENKPPGLDYFELLKEAKTLPGRALASTLRVALLSTASTQFLKPLLEVLFARQGVRAEVYEAPFGALLAEALDDKSGLYRFAPELVVVLPATQALRVPFAASDGGAAAFAERSAGEAAQLWDAVSARCPAWIVQATLARPFERVFGGFEAKIGGGFDAAIAGINARVLEAARSRGRVLIADLDAVSSYLGRGRWFDEKVWIMGKVPCAPACLPHAARAVVDAWAASAGRTVKCVVVDLDNTLWGGVVGDDGPENLHIGDHGEGEAFAAFQRFLLALKRRGILLAVCSRNDRETALRAFRERPDMPLKEDDFAAFVADWNSKADGVAGIAAALSIGLDSLVFLDDDPFERNLLRTAHPSVRVPELPEEPADFVKALCEANLFEAASFSAEDRARAEMYRVSAVRAASRAAFSTPEDYLRSLNMRIEAGRFDRARLPRIAQLIGRSNQFNLTTKRYHEDDCARWMDDAAAFPFWTSLKDDLGDSGLIGVAILADRGGAVEIDEWLMSCRVLMRGVEDFMMNRAFAWARERGASVVRGEYRPTAKNAMVAEFYGRYGFRRTGESVGGAALWELPVADYAPRPTCFAEETAP